MKNSWRKIDPYCYTLKCEHGYANIVELSDGTWRWEIYKNNDLCVELDGWWGIVNSKEEAQRNAERELGL